MNYIHSCILPLQLDIPFLKQRQIIKFNCSGAKFVGFGEIGIDIPPNAIPEGNTGRLEVGVCLCGPFGFDANYRPISPILWLCLQNTQLDKPVRVTLPHIIPDLSEEELTCFGVRFAKADHDCHTDHGGKRMYKFRPCLDVEPSYYSSMGKGYGVLQTKHFCLMCLVAPELGSDMSERAATAHISGYCLVCVRGPSVLHICALFFLKTCLEVSIVDTECLLAITCLSHVLN